jgi:hypothetical protein
MAANTSRASDASRIWLGGFCRWERPVGTTYPNDSHHDYFADASLGRRRLRYDLEIAKLVSRVEDLEAAMPEPVRLRLVADEERITPA